MRTTEIKCHVESANLFPHESFRDGVGKQGFTVHCVTLLQVTVFNELSYW